MTPSSHRRSSQRGSALLVVLVFAAVIAIMLYRELPVATFEAQRQKEELLIDRGNEYKRAVQLYVRKIQSFPPSLDALENTNRMRFLRNRYTDPFTGKADWRLLHAGPGGMITDSKIKKATNTLTGASGSQASTLGSGSSVTSPFANSFNGADPNGQQSAPVNNFPQRPPAVSANGGMPTQSGGTDMFGQSNGQPVDPQNPTDPNQTPATAPYPGYPGPTVDSSTAGTNSGAMPMGPGRFRGGNPAGNSYPPGQFGASAPPIDPMQGALNTNNPPPVPTTPSQFSTQSAATASTTQASSGLGTMNSNSVGAGIAGVASTSPGKTIKVVNDQSDRSLWEFVYDMQKEANSNAPSLGNNNGNQSNGTNGNTGQSQTGIAPLQPTSTTSQ